MSVVGLIVRFYERADSQLSGRLPVGTADMCVCVPACLSVSVCVSVSVVMMPVKTMTMTSHHSRSIALLVQDLSPTKLARKAPSSPASPRLYSRPPPALASSRRPLGRTCPRSINVNEYQDPIKFRKLQDRRLKPGHFKKMLLKKMTNHIHESSGSYGKTQTFQYVAQKRDRSRSGIFRIVEPRNSIKRRCSETRPITFVKFETRMVNRGHFNMFANPISICNFEIIRFYSTILKLLDYGTE